MARFSVEYRNDLLGHVHALGLTGPPARYHSGHEGSDEPFDWPANAAACQELQGLGATVAYTHPVFSALEDGSPAGAFASPGRWRPASWSPTPPSAWSTPSTSSAPATSRARPPSTTTC